MHLDLVQKLRCPARDCGGETLIPEIAQVETLSYSTGALEEIREGSLRCPACGRVYPIHEFVPSFAELFPESLAEEADFWSKWYGLLWSRGYMGFFDLRASVAPCLLQGIDLPAPGSVELREAHGMHVELADYPDVRAADWILDVGCGTGWSSLFLARRGHRVVGFDPAGANMVRAKRYAIEQGVYIEYMAAALGYLAFQPESFDAIFALYSLHHVPGLHQEMRVLRDWLREGGVIALDEHVRDDPTLTALTVQMLAWADAEVIPQHRTLAPDAFADLPKTAISAHEGAGSQDVIDSILENFTLESFSSRYIALALFGFLFYLSRGCDEEGYYYSAAVVDRLLRLFNAAWPEKAECAALIARKGGTPPANHDLLVAQARIVSAGRVDWPEALAEKAEQATQSAQLQALRQQRAAMEGGVQAKDAYIRELEAQIARKNAHIGQLETRVRAQQRALDRLPVRVVRRVFGGRLRRR